IGPCNQRVKSYQVIIRQSERAVKKGYGMVVSQETACISARALGLRQEVHHRLEPWKWDNF
ncbi:MAG: hypothetical protein U0J30_07155, partial [Megasphaera sp.]|nr:hypothetical protein [Megasphaera sp.]